MPSVSAPGDRLLAGRYRLTRVLGRGGMGTVWEARDEVLGREVAVKEVVPPPELPPQERRVVRERSLREARAAARISHPSAVTVYDVVEDDGRPWIVMQRLHARSLADVLRDEGPLSTPDAVRVGLSVLDALGAAHAARVLHRDVKPANVMLTEDGGAVLTDFGIATVDGDPTLTATGLIVGSPAYLAPERARGEAPTTASDLWSLGATLYAAVAGRSPFQREGQLPTLTAVVTEPPPELPGGGPLAPVVRALLDKDPLRRPSVAQARALLLAAAREAEVPEPEPVAPPPAAPPPAPTVVAAPVPVAEPAPVAESAPVAEPAPVAQPAPAPAPAPGPSPRRRRVLSLVVLLAVLAAVVVTSLLLARDPGDRDRRGAAGPTPPAAPSATSSTAPSGTPSGTGAGRATTPAGTAGSSPGASPGGTAGAVPAGFRRHDDPTGFSIAVPEGWTRSTQSTRTYFREPGTGRYLQVDQTTHPKPDAVADWQRQETAVARRLPGYRRIRIEAVPYRGWDAADWEFTWRSGGRRVHVLSRNVRVSDERAYALYWSVPHDRWTESRPLFDVFAATFRPAP